jgi:hydroxypyruvate isomerase
MKYAFCLEMLYERVPFIDRLQLAKKDGISKIEFWDWRDKDFSKLQDKMDQLDMSVCNISGNRNFGMIDPNERTGFIDEVIETAKVAKKIRCPNLMLLVQSLEEDGGGRIASVKLSDQEIKDNIIACGKELGSIADKYDLDMVIEPLNTAMDHPRYELNSSNMAFRVIKKINHPRVKVLYDIYHMAMQDENIMSDIENNLKDIGHFHVADKPGRNEPGTGDINYPLIVALLKKLNYQGIIGFELLPESGNNQRAIKRIFEIF